MKNQESVKHTTYNAERVLRNVFEILCLSVFIFLFVTSLFVTVIGDLNSGRDTYYFVSQSIFRSVLKILIYFILLNFGQFVFKKISRKVPLHFLAICFSVYAMLVSFYFIHTLHVEPWADAGICFGLADAFNKGIFTSFEVGGYVGIFPHQLGLITVERILLYLFGTRYEVLQYILIPLIGLFVYSGFRVTFLMSKENIGACFAYFWAVSTFLPLFLYVTMPYGDLPSACLVIFAFWMILENNKCPKWWKCLFTFVSLSLAVLIRQNTIIFLIAFGVMEIVRFGRRKKESIQLLLILLLVPILTHFSIQIIYHEYLKDTSAVAPKLAWVSMGLTYETDGWWNDFIYRVMEESGYNKEVASEISGEDIRQQLEHYKEQPYMMLRHLYRKAQIQWNAPMLQGFNLVPVNIKDGTVSQQLFWGKLRGYAEKYMDVQQSFLYLCLIVYLVAGLLDKKRDIVQYGTLIGVYGGFLFTMIWETKTRYAFPYIIISLPYSAVGFEKMSRFLVGKLMPAVKRTKECRDE